MFDFLKKKKVFKIKFPIKGEAIDITKVPDEVFAGKMVGDGLAIVPEEGRVYSPVDGKVVLLFPSKHAIGLQTEYGLELLIHIGVDTVHMNGEGFEYLVVQNQEVKAGDALMLFDLKLIGEKAKSIITPIIITNMDEVNKFECNYGSGKTSDVIINVEMK